MLDNTRFATPTDMIEESRVEREKVERAIEKAQQAITEHARHMLAERDAAQAKSARARRRPGYAAPP